MWRDITISSLKCYKQRCNYLKSLIQPFCKLNFVVRLICWRFSLESHPKVFPVLFVHANGDVYVYFKFFHRVLDVMTLHRIIGVYYWMDMIRHMFFEVTSKQH